MTNHDINLAALIPYGKVKTSVSGGMFAMTVTSAVPFAHCNPQIKCAHYVEIPDRYSLPLRIDITAKIDSPALYLLLGSGHVNFGVHEYEDNRRLDDICEPQYKIKFFDSAIPINEFADISLIYDFKEMQILVNGEERYYSNKEKYMKSRLFPEMNKEGFSFGISCGKHTDLTVKSIHITEYDGTAGIVREGIARVQSDYNEYKPPVYPAKRTFEESISLLSPELQAAVTDIDIWLRALRPMKFKRQVGKYGAKITYLASEHGFSYAVHPAGDKLFHTLQWYLITNGKPETWGRKANRMEETLLYIAEKDPDFARRMFDNLHECTGGYGEGCLAKTPYTFEGMKKISCHGKMRFKMSVSDFEDVKRFIGAVNETA